MLLVFTNATIWRNFSLLLYPYVYQIEGVNTRGEWRQRFSVVLTSFIVEL